MKLPWIPKRPLPWLVAIAILGWITLRLTGFHATAKCGDGSYSCSRHHSGTCSGHHGVARWLR